MIRAFLLILLFFSGVAFSQNKLHLIPYPQKVEFQKGEFIIPENFKFDKNLPVKETAYFKSEQRECLLSAPGKGGRRSSG